MADDEPKTELSADDKVKRLLDLYKIYSDDLKKFDTICWQFPLALVSANFFGVNWFRAYPIALSAMAVINFLFLLPLTKHIHLRRPVVKALHGIETKLREVFDTTCIPDFAAAEGWWLRGRTLFWLAYGLLGLNLVLFISALVLVFRDR